ncbi:MAG TPA: hypothetical protein DF296_02585 [Candidatus Margulisbacteria bacterium]|nr:MAG: hypothetical protein A2X42_11820 [Candidatus Margulisbacteria bacterium GWF2_38_17]OGI11565.1 MAG: hypothetical protein A2X41_10045 [Candidatus Margulisbacteria bacterium GWE2_39_32]HCT84066.1 hypothetical protein [Candidatus Margulisiibacteriota bacterium]
MSYIILNKIGFKKNTAVSIMAILVLFAFNYPVAAMVVRGITEPFIDATLSATVQGRIASININDGMYVTKGSVILSLASEQEVLEVNRRKLISESRAELNVAVSRVELLQAEKKATQELYNKTQSVSKEDLHKKILECKTAEEELESIRTNKIKEDLEYKIAAVQLNERNIVAPFNGTVVKHFLQIGENCNPQQPLIRLVDAYQCRFTAFIADGLTHRLKVGTKVYLNIGDSRYWIRKIGSVEHISPVVDPASGLREVRVLFGNEDGRVNPGVPGSMILE